MTLHVDLEWKVGELKGEPTNFIEKIWRGLFLLNIVSVDDYIKYSKMYREKFGTEMFTILGIQQPKFHSIVYDSNNKWEEGKDIHFTIKSGSRNRFQIAPTIKCKSAQPIAIGYSLPIQGDSFLDTEKLTMDGVPYAFVDNDINRVLNFRELVTLSSNEGFDSIEEFYNHYEYKLRSKIMNKSKIVHWTLYKY